MTDSRFNLKWPTIEEANRVTKPLFRAKQEARLALEQAEVDYLAAWQEAYKYAKEQGF